MMFALLLALAGHPPLVMDTTARPLLRVTRATGPIAIDGLLNEAIWKGPPTIDRMVQTSPNDGAPATEATEVRLTYDGNALYVAARLRDRSPDSVMAILSRRDANTQSDFFAVYIDPTLDGRNGFYFLVSAAGVQADGTLYNDDWDDQSWDGVWESAVRRDSTGWVAELRIPFSQLRVTSAVAAWGINVGRGIGRRNEVSYFTPRPQAGSGFVSRFAELAGFKGVTAPPRLEVVPYVTARAKFAPSALGDPFFDGSSTRPGVGGDLRMGLGSRFQLNATINPDFGQVEVDPAVVNLTDVETFYDEKRPFFVEGNDVFRFGFGGANNFNGFNWVNIEPFYSRRIGRAPQGAVPDATYSDTPEGTHILGAAKITGHLGSWKLGLMNAVTRREYARLSTLGETSRAEVEPLTEYGVVRLSRDFAAGRHGLGFLGTLTDRAFKDDALQSQLNGTAALVGVDGWVTLDAAKRWVLSGWTATSRISGSAERISAVQRAGTHYFQRPDADYLEYDSTATSMTGTYGRLTLNKQQGAVLFNAALGVVSPGFDVNDLGFVGRTDVINAHVLSGYRWTRPGSWYQYAQVVGALFATGDFGGVVNATGLWAKSKVTLRNFSQVQVGMFLNPVATLDDRLTRGGPRMESPPAVDAWVGWDSDARKPFTLSLYTEGQTYGSIADRALTTRVTVGWRPVPNLTLSAGPSFNYSRNTSQYLRSAVDPLATATFGRRYLFGDLSQKTLSADIRANWIFSPKLSLEVFMQPLVSSGRYLSIREFRQPRTYTFRDYGTEGSTYDKDAGVVDPDGAGPAPAIVVGHPDFTIASLRGNAVFRWEYARGSTLYLVWTQSRANDEMTGEFSPRRAFSNLLDTRGTNVLMLKATYWISR